MLSIFTTLILLVTLWDRIPGLLAYTGNDPDVRNDVSQLIVSKGYPSEVYTVQTEDDYLLSMQRIPFGRLSVRGVKQEVNGTRPAVLLIHSLISSTAEWVLNFPEQSLGFILADGGYDVWLGCLRGCTYSRRNLVVPTNTNKFWDFSWEDNGSRDLPAMVDFVLKKTGQEKLFLIGHSMGTTVNFVFLSLKPEYNKKIRAFMAMAPVANLTYLTTSLRLLLPFRDQIYKLFLATSHGEFTLGPAYDFLSKIICGKKPSSSLVCSNLAFLADGVESPQQFNQVILNKQFARYDYGREGNFQRYGQTTPPAFPLELISCPVALFWSVEDQFADPTDVATLRVLLKNLVEDYRVPFSPWTHLDSVIALQAKKYIYDRLLTVMSKY